MERNNIIKGQYGIPIIAPPTSWKEWKRRLDKGSEKILKVLEPVGKAFVKGIAGLGSNYGTSSVPYVPRTVEELKREEKSLKIRELQVEKVMPYLSPSNHVVAWTLGSFNPKVGQLKIAEWGPSALLASLGVDAIGFKYVPKGIKVATKNSKAIKMANTKNGTVVRNINGKTRIQLPTHTDAKPREFVMDPQGNNKYYIHMRVWDDVDKHIPGNISNVEKNNLFQTLYETLPDNAEILFPKSGPENYGTRGTVAGLQRLSRDPRFQPGTPGTLYYKGKNNEVRTYQGTSFIKKPLFGFEGYPYAYEGTISMSDVQGFINNDIIPRLREQGHLIESYTPNIRSADFKNDLFDLKMRRENGGAWFSPSTNDITLRGPLENLSFDLVLHETGGHGIRYNMQPDYRPVSREVVNDYLTNIYDPVKQLPLLKAHIGREVFNDFEATTLGDAYPEVAGYFEGYINGLSGKKLPPEMVTLRILDELGAVNTQFRAKLSENGRLTGKALNKKIQLTPEGVILRMEIEQGYTSMGILERISKITGVSMDELNFYNPASLQKLVERFPELKTITDKVKYAMTHVAVGAGVMYGLNQYGMVELKKKGGKTHKPSQRSVHRPWGHRSILDNEWQSTKLLKNKKNVYGTSR